MTCAAAVSGSEEFLVFGNAVGGRRIPGKAADFELHEVCAVRSRGIVTSPTARHSEPFARHSERSEESAFAQGKLREESAFLPAADLCYILRVRTSYVYIMASRSRTLYTGVTNSLERRAAEHKRHRTPGFTDRYRIERLVYFETWGHIRDAIQREKQIKGWRRSKKIALIEAKNATWADLSEGWYGKEKQILRPDKVHRDSE
jgi:putative endonuclease